VAQAAGGTVADLEREFGSFDALRAELMFHWLDQIRSAVVEALEHERGPRRLVRAVEVWLNANLERAAVRTLLRELRIDPVVAERIFERMRGFIIIMQMEFRELGWVRHEAAGRLHAAMAIEIANSEFTARRRLPALRRTLYDSLERS
jgi:hypothetical protein